MKSEADSPSIWHIRSCLLSSIDFAGVFVVSHPQHARFHCLIHRRSSENQEWIDAEAAGYRFGREMSKTPPSQK